MYGSRWRDIPPTAGLVDACSAQIWKLRAIAGNVPSVLDKARWMAVDLKEFRDESIAKVKQRQLPLPLNNSRK